MTFASSDEPSRESYPDANLLSDETSPYLLQHQSNPVHWRPWGPEAFAEAKASGKPVMLSIGYAACHWCHVMAHESFENEEIAAVMNRLFVNIKVDREERPDVDAIYQHALQMLGEQGGWPLTMFLTADREPFWGGTYFPSEPRYGRPGFTAVLERISEIFQSEPDKVRQNAQALSDALKQLESSVPGTDISIDVLDQVASKLTDLVDFDHGGIRGAPKFPQVPIFQLLWRAWQRTGTTRYRDAVTITLDRMCQGGIYDHLGGGFARYSVDGQWLVPHFEKMLYDNAQLLSLLSLVWRETKSDLYRTRVRETIEWLQREMLIEGCGFAGTLDADSEGEEGRFYVWNQQEIDALLGADADAFKAAYDVRPSGNWEGKTILNRSADLTTKSPEDEAILKRCRDKLLDARSNRIRPALDDKILADWNGLAICALVDAGLAFDNPEWIELAVTTMHSVTTRLTKDGRIHHSFRAGKPAHPATLDDHAALADAAIALHQATGKEGFLEQAKALVDEIQNRFHDANGGYFVASADVEDVLVRQKSAFDNATPSGNGILVGVLARLYLLTGDVRYRDNAEGTIRAFSGEIGRNAFSLATLLNNSELLQSAIQIVICGDAGSEEYAVLRRAALDLPAAHIVIQTARNTDHLESHHPAFGKDAVDGRASAYVCRNQTCSLPITDPAELVKAVAAA